MWHKCQQNMPMFHLEIKCSLFFKKFSLLFIFANSGQRIKGTDFCCYSLGPPFMSKFITV